MPVPLEQQHMEQRRMLRPMQPVTHTLTHLALPADIIRTHPAIEPTRKSELPIQNKEKNMRKILTLAAASLTLTIAGTAAKAQVDLSAYADAEGFLDVQTLTCAQLAGTWQGDADRLASWYSGWYNGLAKKHYMDITKGKEAEHEVIVYCKANPQIKIIQAMDIIFKSMRERAGIKVQ
jgi:hypothetical protein